MRDTNTREISLKDLFFCTLSKWRMLLLCTLCGALLLGAFGAYKASKSKVSEADQKKQQEAYETELNTYNTNKALYEKQLANVDASLAQQDYFREHSLMLRIDPYNSFRTVLYYYVNTGYEIMPELYYQDPNYTAVITNSYVSALRRPNLNDLLSTVYQEEVYTGNPVSGSKTFLSVSSDAGNGTITVTVNACSQRDMDVVVTKVKTIMAEMEPVLRQSIREHTVTVLDEVAAQVIDLDFASVQQSFEENYANLLKSKSSIQSNLNKLTEPKAPSTSSVSIKKQAVKYAAIGAVAGLLLSAAVCVFMLIAGDSVLSAEELKSRSSLPVLGSFPGEGKKRTGGLDGAIAKKLGFPKQETADAVRYIAAAGKLYLDSDEVILVGQEAEAVAARLKEADPDTNYVPAGDLKHSPAAVEALSRAKAVLCVEKWRKSRYGQLSDELTMIRKAVPQDKIAVVIAK